MFALHHLKKSGLDLTRATLRSPFFIECYPAAVFAFLFGAGMTIVNGLPSARLPGGLIASAATIWYIAVQTVWISHIDKQRWRAFFVVLWQMLKAAMIMIAIAVAYAYGAGLLN
jgi:hypothetical protein